MWRRSKQLLASVSGSEACRARTRNVVVIGGTGGVGRYVIQHASRSGHNIRTLVRSRKKFDDVMQQIGMSTEETNKIAVVEGSALSSGDVERAVKERFPESDSKSTNSTTDYVISSLGNVRGEKSFIVEHGTQCVLDAVNKLNAERLEQGHATSPCRMSIMTSIGCGDSSKQIYKLSWFFSYVIKPFFLKGVFGDLEKAEGKVFEANAKSDSGIGTYAAICRPGGLDNSPGTGRFRLIDGTELEGITSGLIPRADVAAGMVSLIENRDWDGKAVSIVLPEDLALQKMEEKSAGKQFFEKWSKNWTRLVSAKMTGSEQRNPTKPDDDNQEKKNDSRP